MLGQGKFRVWVGVRLSLGFRIIVRVRISVMVRVSTTQNFKHNHRGMLQWRTAQREYMLAIQHFV